MTKQPFSRKLKENIDYIDKLFSMPKTFDLVKRDLCIGGKSAVLVFIDGLANGELLATVLRNLLAVRREDLSVDAIKKVMNQHLNAVEVNEVATLSEGIDELLAGPQLLILDGEERGIVIDARTWLSRGPDEPESEKTTRGSNEGFVETMLFNLASIRRRIRDPQLRAEVFKVGRRSRSDVCLCYIEDIANGELVDWLRTKLESIEIDGIPLADKNIEEFLVGPSLNPLPRVRATERPDSAAAHLLEGHVVILTDTSPTAMILPAPMMAHTQSMEEYRQSVVTGTYLTLLRLAAIPISLLLPALWLLVATHPQYLPEGLEFIGPKETGVLHLALQFILATIGIDMIWMASIHTPNTLATSLGLIGALMLGEFSVKVGLFSSEVILYLAISAIANFTIPNYELSLVIKLFRFLMLILTGYFELWGFLGGLGIVFLIFIRTKSFGVPYLWPVIPFNWNGLKSYLTRQSTLALPRKRPSYLKTTDSTRKPKKR